MIGEGTWSGVVRTVFYRGEVSFTLREQDGSLSVDLRLPSGVIVPKIEILSHTEQGNSLLIRAETAVMPDKVIDIQLDFDGDTLNGVVKIPILGKLKIESFTRVA